MITLVSIVTGLALVDSINPSAIGVTLFLMLSGQRYLSRVGAYLLGVVGTYLLVGVAVLLGLDALSGALADAWDSTAAWVVTGLVGLAMFVYSWVAPKEKPPRRTAEDTGRRGHARLVLLGAGVSAIEFSTALPYLGAIALVSRSEIAPAGALALLAYYNLVMSLPVVVLVAVFATTGDRFRSRLASWQETLRSGGRGTFLWVLGIAGFLLMVHTVAHFEFFGLVEIPDPPPAGG